LAALRPLANGFKQWAAGRESFGQRSGRRNASDSWLANERLSVVEVGLTLILLLLRERANVIIS